MSGTFIFKLKIKNQARQYFGQVRISEFTMNITIQIKAGGGLTRSASAKYKQESFGNNNSSTMGSTRIDLYKSLPEMKCTDFLASFIKMFNISIFDASPSDDKLFWLTPNDLLVPNKTTLKKKLIILIL